MNAYTFPRHFADPSRDEINVLLTDDHLRADLDDNARLRMLSNDLSPFFVDNISDLYDDVPTFHTGNDTYTPDFSNLLKYIDTLDSVITDYFFDDPMLIDLAIRECNYALPRRSTNLIHSRSDLSRVYARLYAHYVTFSNSTITHDRVFKQINHMIEYARDHMPNAHFIITDDCMQSLQLPSLMHLINYCALTPSRIISHHLIPRSVNTESFLDIVLYCNSHFDMPRYLYTRYNDLYEQSHHIDFDDLRSINVYMTAYTTLSPLSMRYPANNHHAHNNVDLNTDHTHQYYNTLPMLDSAPNVCKFTR